MLALAMVIHGILLVPAYVFLEAQVNGRKAEVARISEGLNTAEEKQVDARVSALQEDTAYLTELNAELRASVAVRAILGVSRPGVRLSGFGYTKPKSGAVANMTVTGIADTRETLRAYVLALQAEPFIASADLPVSAYAKDKDIPFTIALTGNLTP